MIVAGRKVKQIYKIAKDEYDSLMKKTFNQSKKIIDNIIDKEK